MDGRPTKGYDPAEDGKWRYYVQGTDFVGEEIGDDAAEERSCIKNGEEVKTKVGGDDRPRDGVRLDVVERDVKPYKAEEFADGEENYKNEHSFLKYKITRTLFRMETLEELRGKPNEVEHTNHMASRAGLWYRIAGGAWMGKIWLSSQQWVQLE